MRRRLVLGAAAITTTIVLAFAIPLGLLVRTVANDRALTSAERSAQALSPVLASVTDQSQIEQIVSQLDNGDDRLSVVQADGQVIGEELTADASIELARSGRSFSTPVPGGERVLVAVQAPDGSIDVVTVFVPASVLDRGVASAWLLLGALSLALVLVAVAVADRLARTVTGPVGDLAATAERLGQGDLDARVEPAGPPEIVEVGDVLNRLAGRIGELLAAERELVADLSHRLRTPITALRLDADALHDADERDRVGGDVDELVRAVDRLIREARRTEHRTEGATADLAEITRERVRFWAALADEQDRSFAVDVADGPCLVGVSGADLEAALDALLGNVLAHTPDGTGFRVSVAAAGSDEDRAAWLLVLDDDGPGFDEDAAAERGTSGAGSTGLGLDIVRRTAEQTGGTMTLGRSTSGGARIEVELRGPAL